MQQARPSYPYLDTSLPQGRIDALDGLRGILSLVVVIDHFFQREHSAALIWAGQVAVLCFFTMSGYVLARSYDGRPGVFVAKRLARLWPLYGVCVFVGWGLTGRLPSSEALLAWPPHPYEPILLPNPPDWSLHVELWMTPVLLAMFASASLGRVQVLLMTLVVSCTFLMDPHLFWPGFFAIGVAATRFQISVPAPVPRWSLWLGKVSYSLYMTHWLVMSVCLMVFGAKGMAVAALLVMPTAWCVWWAVERPSIMLSRRIGRIRNIAAKPVRV